MTISVPTAFALVYTNVIDPTTLFDNTNYVASYPIGSRLLFGSGIYENTVETVPVEIYDILQTYQLNQLVFKDGLMQKIASTSSEVPKQPWDYDSVDETLNLDLWANRYAKVRGIPSYHEENKSVSTASTSAYGFCVQFSADGTKMFQTDSTTEKIYQTDLAAAWDISSGGSPMGGIWFKGLFFTFKPDGTHVYCCTRTGDVIDYKLNTTWQTYANYSIERQQYFGPDIQGISFNLTGTKCYITHGDTQKITQYFLSDPWNILTSIVDVSINSFRYGGYNNLPITPVFNTAGTKYYEVERGYDTITEVTMSTAWDISTGELTGRIDGTLPETLAIKPDGSRFWVLSGAADLIRQYTMPIAWDLSSAYTSVFPLNAYDYRSPNIYVKHSIYYSGSSLLSQSTLYSPDGNVSYGPVTVNVYSALTFDSLDLPATTYTNGVDFGWVANTIVIGEDGLYLRTNLSIDGEVIAIDAQLYSIINSPLDIPNFSYIEESLPYRPFDGKNYTSATRTNVMTYIIKGDIKFNMVAFGKVKADSVVIIFRDVGNTIITTVGGIIDTSRDIDGNLEDWYTTAVYYASEVIEAGGTVEVTLTSTGEVELSTLMLGMSVDGGFTNLIMTHKYKDFSVFEYDEWGNADYTERARVSTYNGSVDIPISDYDRTDRLMTSLGKNLVIIDGSDANNEEPNGLSIFASTQRIGRFLSFDQKTLIADGDIGNMATYNFTLEEIV